MLGILIWGIVTFFFTVLSLDERFMFHEQIKERIIFGSTKIAESGRWIYEFPVLIASGVGIYFSILLWQNLQRHGRILLIWAVFFGSSKVAFDVFCLGAFWEGSFKLLAEFALVCALFGEVDLVKRK